VRNLFESRLEEAVSSCRGPVYIFFSPTKDAYFIEHAPKSAISTIDENVMPSQLKKSGKLVQFLKPFCTI
jgi:hypothetical protein